MGKSLFLVVSFGLKLHGWMSHCVLVVLIVVALLLILLQWSQTLGEQGYFVKMETAQA